MTTQLARWGNSLGLRIPKALAVELHLGEGDPVTVTLEQGAIVVRPARVSYSLDNLVNGINTRNLHDATDGGEPAGRETW